MSGVGKFNGKNKIKFEYKINTFEHNAVIFNEFLIASNTLFQSRMVSIINSRL